MTPEHPAPHARSHRPRPAPDTSGGGFEAKVKAATAFILGMISPGEAEGRGAAPLFALNQHDEAPTCA